MFNSETFTADAVEDTDGNAATQSPVCQMDSTPRNNNPDSPKEICVKLMLSWSGI